MDFKIFFENDIIDGIFNKTYVWSRSDHEKIYKLVRLDQNDDNIYGLKFRENDLDEGERVVFVEDNYISDNFTFQSIIIE